MELPTPRYNIYGGAMGINNAVSYESYFVCEETREEMRNQCARD